MRTLPRPPSPGEKLAGKPGEDTECFRIALRTPSKVKKFVSKEGTGDFFLDFGF